MNETDPGTRSRTQPVFAAGNANFSDPSGGSIAGARFLTSFNSEPGDLFGGKLERLRYECKKPTENEPPEAELQELDTGSGDDFRANTDTAKKKRKVYTVVAEPDKSGRIHSTRTIRPLYKGSDGDGLGEVGVLSGDPKSFMVSGAANEVDAQIDPRAIVGASNTCQTTNPPCCFATPSELEPNAATCRTRFLEMQLGLKTSNADIEFQRASVLGAIMRTTPIVVGPPQDYLRDESYANFQRTMGARPSVLYAPTVDGQLHAFEITKTTDTLNELWTFMPPAVLPRIPAQFPDRYNAAPQSLLDGPIIVRDVAGKADPDDKERFLMRTRTDALDPSPDNVRWHSILVGAFGSTPGYYAARRCPGRSRVRRHRPVMCRAPASCGS